MKFKKSIAVLMAAAMTLGAAYPAAAVTTDADSAPAASSETAAAGAVTAVSIIEQEDENLTNGQVFKVPEITVKYQTAKDCTLMVCVYTALDEFGSAQQLCAMTGTSVKAGSTEATVKIDRGSVPLNCTICAYLITDKGEPLSPQFKTVVKRELPEHDVKPEKPAAISTAGLVSAKSDNFALVAYNGTPNHYYVLYKYIEKDENVPESYWMQDGAPDVTKIQYLELVDSLPGWTQEQADAVESVVFQSSYSDSAWTPGYHPEKLPNGAYCNVQYISFPAKMTTVQGFGYNRSEKKSTDAEGKTITTVTEGGFKSLKAVNIPDTVKIIGSGAFNSCPNLKSAVISDSVGTIEGSAFGNCKALNYVSLPAGLTELSASVFAGCESLKTIEIPSTVKSIGNACFNNAGIECITLPDSLETLGAAAFMLCKELDTVQIPDGVTEIPSSCFNGTSMREIELHKNVKKIAGDSFPRNNFTVYGNSEMKDIEKVCASAQYWSFVAKDSKPVTENFTDLKPNTVYNFYRFTNTNEKNMVIGSNTLLYVTQAVSDKDGKLSVTYRPANAFGSGEPFSAVVCGETVTPPAETTAPAVTTTAPVTTTDPATTSATARTVKDPSSKICGDANQDGKIDVSDAVLVARFAVMDTTVFITDQGRLNADANGDGKVSDQDITSIILYIARRTTTLPYDPTKTTTNTK